MTTQVSTTTLDEVTLEIAWGRLQAAVDEAEVTLVRTAFSPIIREAYDFGVVLLDAAGRSIGQSQRSMPSFVGTIPRTLKAALDVFPADSLKPNDVLATNDPWLGTGHLPDITMMRPIYREGRLIAYVGCVAHWADIGGALWSGDTNEVFEEGLRIPLCKLQAAGQLDKAIMAIILGNVRLPQHVLGDVHAQLATLEVGARRLIELLDDMELDDPTPLFTEVQERSESAMRRAIAELPDGTYVHDMEIDGVDEPLVLRASLTVDGDQLLVDWTGSSPQVPRGSINETYNHAFAMTAYPIKCALCPDVPNSEGSYRPISMSAPEGTIINARHPAAVASRQTIGHFIASVMFGALAQVVPGRVLADSGSPCPRVVFSGLYPNGTRYGAVLTLSGGMGARHDRDGLSAAPFPSNAGTTSVEIVEASTPLIFRQRALVADSGGAGRFRGGLGVATKVEVGGPLRCVVSIMTDRIDHPPLGRFGGHPGTPNVLSRASGRPVLPKSRTELAPGDVLLLQTAGGAGFGSPEERDRAFVASDLEADYITVETARIVYGQVAR